MRVLIQIERFSSREGGAERYAVDLARGLAGAGVEVYAAATRFEGVPEGVEAIRIDPFPGPKALRVYDFGRRCALLHPDFDVVHGLIKTWAVDVHHPHTGSHAASLEGLDRSAPSRGRACAAKFARALSLRQAVFRWIEREQYGRGRAKRYLAVSERVAREMVDRHGAEADRVRVLYNPVDASRFTPGKAGERARARERIGVDGDRLQFLFAAHHFRLKGLWPLLRALSRLGRKDWDLLVIGRGKAGPFRRRARALGLGEAVRFFGGVADPERYYRSADVFVLPTFYDPCSLTVLEGMASGLPVLTSRWNGASELLEAGREGLVIDDPSDVRALADRLAFFFDPDRRRAMGHRAREKAETLSPAKHLQAVLRLYEEVAREKKRGGGP